MELKVKHSNHGYALTVENQQDLIDEIKKINIDEIVEIQIKMQPHKSDRIYGIVNTSSD